MTKKIWKLILWGLLIIGSCAVVLFCDKNGISIGSVVVSACIGIFIDRGFASFNDLFDTTNWKTTQRRLKRGGFIKDNTIIRISFAYLYRIKIGNKYFLIQNSRNTGKYQPVGGVYKFHPDERYKLNNLYNVMDDNKIFLDESSRNDYRLRIENRHLRKFMKRFDSRKAKRESVENLGREFKEELIDTGILNWKKISYRYCGRHFTELKYGDHFQTYELLLADVVELILFREQENDLRNLEKQMSEKYRFATAEQIECLGMNIEEGQLYEWIGDHTKKILQENEGYLIRMPRTGESFSVDL